MRNRVVLAAVALAALAVFFRGSLLSGFDLVPGDMGDTRFNLAILEHWWRVVQGLEPWLSPNFFHPVPQTLAYSDGLVLMALPYGVARALGLAPFHGLTVVLLVWTALGLAGTMLFLRRCLSLSLPAVAGGGVAFACGSVVYQSLAIGHVQLLAVQLVPWLACLAWVWVENRRRPGPVRLLAGAALVGLVAALLVTSFYVAWFLIFQGLVVAVLIVAWRVAHGSRPGLWARVRDWVRGHKRHAAALALVLGPGMIPFLLLYGPMLRRGAGRSYDEVARALPTPSQLHFPNGNALWEPVAIALMPWLEGNKDELGKGLTWGLLAVSAVTLVALLRWRGGFARASEVGEPESVRFAPQPVDQRALALILGGSVCVCWALLVKVNGHSLWSLVFGAIPGGSVIRAGHRFNIVLSFSVVTVAAMGVDWLGRTGKWGGRLAMGLAVLLAVEQVNLLPNTLSNRAAFVPLASLPRAPESCRAFVLVAVGPDARWRRWSAQLDAVMVAQAQNLPTLNGYSGNAPPGWDFFSPNDWPRTRVALLSWADQYALWPGLCGLDLARGLWLPLSRDRVVGEGP